MKGILTFDLPEDSHEFEAASNGMKYKILIDDILNRFRSDLKHNPDKLSGPTLNYAEKIRDWVLFEMTEQGLTRE